MKTAAYSNAKRDTGFTLVELMIAIGIAGVVSAGCLVSFLALQKGFGYCNGWMEVRASQLRVIDALDRDIRNALDRDSSNANLILLTSAAATAATPATIASLTLPMRYSAYETSGARAGEPTFLATAYEPRIGRNGRADYSLYGTMSVTYKVVSGTGSVRRIQREATWTGGAATRTIADFGNGVAINFSNRSGGTFTVSDSAIVTTLTARFSARSKKNVDANRNPYFEKTVSDTLYLRTRTAR